MHFPQSISFTITNSCNLRCQMCGQWSEEGYVRSQPQRLKQEMSLPDWIRLVDELADHGITSLLLRGGEPFMFPGIIELLEHIHAKGMHTSIDTNGTRLAKYAEALTRIGDIHLTISLDGTEDIHDQVRGVKGTYAALREGIRALKEWEQKNGQIISKSLNYTISPYGISALGDLPEAVRSLGVEVVAIVPYYYFPAEVGKAYEQEMQQAFGCQAYSWTGFHHQESGVNFGQFQAEHRKYLDTLNGIYDFPYMPFTDDQYRTWFADALTPVAPTHCTNIEKLIDIQPNGDANFCVDFPDYVFGNVKEASIEEVWNSDEAERFRRYRREKPLPLCHRCGAKYMSEM